MIKPTRLPSGIVAVVALAGWTIASAQNLPALPRTPASAQPAAEAASAAAPAKDLFPQRFFDYMLKERLAQGQRDSPELRAAIRDELNTRELLVREARKKGIDKIADVRVQMDLASQTVLVRAQVADWTRANPISDAALRKEYDTIKSQLGNREYKVRHILVDKEDEAREIIAALQKGDRFEKLAERSKDAGSKDRGGDLDWNSPANFVKPFSDAMVRLEKGKFTAQPVQTQFGWHVIRLDDSREARVPTFDEVKPQLMQRLQGQHLEGYFRDLRAKNNVR